MKANPLHQTMGDSRAVDMFIAPKSNRKGGQRYLWKTGRGNHLERVTSAERLSPFLLKRRTNELA